MTFESRPGHQAGKLTGRARFYLVSDAALPGHHRRAARADHPRDDDEFLDSFELLDQGPGPPAPARPTPPDRRPVRRASRPRRHPANRAPNPPGRPDRTGPAAAGFYNIPEPASATIEADIRGMGATPGIRVQGLGGSRHRGVRESPAGAARYARSNGSMTTRTWWAVTATPPRADGTNDQHFRLELDLPPNTIIESMAIDGGADEPMGHQAERPLLADRHLPERATDRPVSRRPGRGLLRLADLRPVPQHRDRHRSGHCLRAGGRPARSAAAERR